MAIIARSGGFLAVALCKVHLKLVFFGCQLLTLFGAATAPIDCTSEMADFWQTRRDHV